MPVGFDAVGPSAAGAGATTVTSLTWTHTAVASGVTLVSGVTLDNNPTSATMTCKCDGVAMTVVPPGAVVSGAGGTTGYLESWSIAGIASGARTMLATMTGGSAADMEAGSLSFTGATGLGTAVSSASSATGTTASVTVPSTAGNLVAGFCAAGNTITATTSPATSRFVNNLMGGGGSATGNIAGSTSAGGGSVVMAWSTTSTVAAVLAVEVQGAAAGHSPAPLVSQYGGRF